MQRATPSRLRHLSDQARAQLEVVFPALDFPAPGDTLAWSRLVKDFDAQAATDLAADAPDFPVRQERIGNVDVYVATPPGTEDTGQVHLNFHAGGLIFLGGELVRLLACTEARTFALPTWSVDYGMPPVRPFPAGLDDALTVYRSLIESHRPKDILVSGASAGGNLATALLLRARDEGLPMPAAAVLLSPEVDLTESGDSFNTLAEWDNTLSSLAAVNALYAGDHNLADPYISPLFGDFTGFPPVFLQAGTRDLFLSNSVRMHRRLLADGVRAELHVFEAMPHGMFAGTPEGDELVNAIREFVATHVR